MTNPTNPTTPDPGTTPPTPDTSAPSPPATTPEPQPGAPAVPAAPAEPDYTVLKPAEGYEIPAGELEQLVGILKEAGIAPEAGQKLLDRQAAMAAADRAEQDRLVEQRMAAWDATLKADPEIGGAALDANKAHMVRFLDEFFPPSFREELRAIGLERHPDFVKGMVKAGKAFAEAPLVPSGGSAAPTQEQLLRRLYDNTPELFETVKAA